AALTKSAAIGSSYEQINLTAITCTVIITSATRCRTCNLLLAASEAGRESSEKSNPWSNDQFAQFRPITACHNHCIADGLGALQRHPCVHSHYLLRTCLRAAAARGHQPGSVAANPSHCTRQIAAHRRGEQDRFWSTVCRPGGQWPASVSQCARPFASTIVRE